MKKIIICSITVILIMCLMCAFSTVAYASEREFRTEATELPKNIQLQRTLNNVARVVAPVLLVVVVAGVVYLSKLANDNRILRTKIEKTRRATEVFAPGTLAKTSYTSVPTSLATIFMIVAVIPILILFAYSLATDGARLMYSNAAFPRSWISSISYWALLSIPLGLASFVLSMVGASLSRKSRVCAIQIIVIVVGAIMANLTLII